MARAGAFASPHTRFRPRNRLFLPKSQKCYKNMKHMVDTAEIVSYNKEWLFICILRGIPARAAHGIRPFSGE